MCYKRTGFFEVLGFKKKMKGKAFPGEKKQKIFLLHSFLRK